MFPAAAGRCGAGQFPFFLRRGAVRRGSNIKHQNSLCKQMTLINNIRIKDHYVHDLPENRALLGYARKSRSVGNMAEIAFWKQVHKKMKVFHTTDFDVLQHVNIVLADLRKYIVENYEHADD